jgi:Formate hydrogenlyase subunit 6/NADH:ubiquinone oxidoreductase 23 kD subunit (chain I)
MGIWTILKQNLGLGSRTRKPEETVPYPDTFRGMLSHDFKKCTACGTCNYVCSPGAITFDRSGQGSVKWQYFAGQCTYCGRCIAFCPTGALQFEHSSGPISTDLDAYRVVHSIQYVPCSRCGKPMIPLPASLLVKLYGDPIPEDISAVREMCEECRNFTTTRNLKNATSGRMARRASDLIDRSGSKISSD